ncbi:MAG: N-acetyltransferase [Candidatus Krumholzibacteria bacterium]|nr:N-acetyltransferase [Candidatus Krumholzibacteria bacterium]
MKLRPATSEDLPSITDIYNEAILNTVATFDLETKSVDDMRLWLEKHGADYPVVVCTSEAKVVGYASLNEYSPKKAYAATAEVSVYIDRGSRGKGYGRMLLGAIIEAGAEKGIHSMIARITEGNDISIHLFERFDFTHVGRLREAGTKFGRLLDVDIYQRTLDGPGRKA